MKITNIHVEDPGETRSWMKPLGKDKVSGMRKGPGLPERLGRINMSIAADPMFKRSLRLRVHVALQRQGLDTRRGKLELIP
jgi:hypothetical protein